MYNMTMWGKLYINNNKKKKENNIIYYIWILIHIPMIKLDFLQG